MKTRAEREGELGILLLSKMGPGYAGAGWASTVAEMDDASLDRNLRRFRARKGGER